MPTGEPARQGGYSYLAVLFVVALTAAGLAALGQAWSTATQRERERELLFRGGEIARAIAAYAQATPNPPQQYPRSLDDLTSDSRGLLPRRHLRRAYVDPFTGQPDWELVAEPGQPGAFSAVRSRSEHLLLLEYGPDGARVRVARDLLFSSRNATGVETPAGPASATSAGSAVPR
ncbi:MAG: type II secretion system protein [Comamonadaceae bacterium]|nr:type II secretion system protein [Comamonadaceae bacterium]